MLKVICLVTGFSVTLLAIPAARLSTPLAEGLAVLGMVLAVVGLLALTFEVLRGK